jgi:hypothetical protein
VAGRGTMQGDVAKGRHDREGENHTKIQCCDPCLSGGWSERGGHCSAEKSDSTEGRHLHNPFTFWKNLRRNFIASVSWFGNVG